MICQLHVFYEFYITKFSLPYSFFIWHIPTAIFPCYLNFYLPCSTYKPTSFPIFNSMMYYALYEFFSSYFFLYRASFYAISIFTCSVKFGKSRPSLQCQPLHFFLFTGSLTGISLCFLITCPYYVNFIFL